MSPAQGALCAKNLTFLLPLSTKGFLAPGGISQLFSPPHVHVETRNLPTPRPSTRTLLSRSFSPSPPAQTHISEKALAAVPGAEGHVSGIQAGFFLLWVFFCCLGFGFFIIIIIIIY